MKKIFYILLLFGILTYIMITIPKKIDISRYDKRIFWDSITIIEQQKKIDIYENIIDSLRKNFDTVYIKIKNYQYDTVIVEKLINDTTTDSICKKALIEQRNLIKIQKVAIIKAKKIINKQDDEIQALKQKLIALQQYIDNSRQLQLSKEKQLLKQIHKEKVKGVIVSSAGIGIGILLILTK